MKIFRKNVGKVWKNMKSWLNFENFRIIMIKKTEKLWKFLKNSEKIIIFLKIIKNVGKGWKNMESWLNFENCRMIMIKKSERVWKFLKKSEKKNNFLGVLRKILETFKKIRCPGCILKIME